MARQRLDPEARREAIIQAAMAAFDDVGPDTVNLEVVAERAGVSRALVYTYFQNRQGLVRAVFEVVLADLGDSLARALEGSLTPQERIYRWITTLAGYARDHPHRWQVVRRTVLAPEDGRGLDDLLSALAPRPPAPGDRNPLMLAALVGMVDWTASDLDERGTTELARLAWSGTSGVAEGQGPGPGPLPVVEP